MKHKIKYTEAIIAKDTDNIKPLILHLGIMPIDKMQEAFQFIGSWLGLAEFYDTSHVNYLSHDTVKLLQKFFQLGIQSIKKDDRVLGEKIMEVFKAWSKTPIAHPEVYKSLHAKLDELKKDSKVSDYSFRNFN